MGTTNAPVTEKAPDYGVLGRPVNGDIQHYSEQGFLEQWDPQKFVDALDAVLDLPEVEAVTWEQYTPYFNDGDACVFGLGEWRIKITGAPEDAGDYEDGFYTVGDLDYAIPGTWANDRAGKEDSPWATSTRDEVLASGVDPDRLKEIQDTVRNLTADLGHHEIFLNKTFGDPAKVIATKEGFDVEDYPHD